MLSSRFTSFTHITTGHSIMRQFQPRFLTFISAASMALTIGFTSPAISAPTADFVGGSTRVKLSSEFINALVSLKVTPGVISNGKLRRGVASFPITSGAGDLGTIKLEVNHQGGLSLTGGDTIVELTDFSITNLGGKPILTGLVKANDSLVGRIPLFDLALSGNPTTQSVGSKDHGNLRTQVDVKDVKVTLSKDAASALNSVFKVTAFQPGLNIGTATVKAFVK
jgi:hypothetical protein